MQNNIRQAIEERGMKISFVIDKTGLAKSYFYDVMNGKSVPSLSNARKIADVLGVRLSELFPEDEEQVS
mgnify:CR=1 FL=1